MYQPRLARWSTGFSGSRKPREKLGESRGMKAHLGSARPMITPKHHSRDAAFAAPRSATD